MVKKLALSNLPEVLDKVTFCHLIFFITCAKVLSSLLKEAVNQKALTGLKICKESPIISHLLFVDDSMLCCKVDVQEASKVIEILALYGRASGQMVNFDKSIVFFSRNTIEQMKPNVSCVMDNIREAISGKYLGLPTTIGRTKNQAFSYVKQRVTTKL